MYIYESHLGGLYTSDEPLEWDALYCEECGDSDTELGYVDDNNPDAAWELLKPESLNCIGCKEELDCNGCDKLIDGGSYYGLLYVLNFLNEDFDFKSREYVHLIITAPSGEILVRNASGAEDDFFSVHTLPSCFCYKKELAEKAAIELLPTVLCSQVPVQLVKTIRQGSDIHYIMRCNVTAEDVDDENAFTNGAAWYCTGDWAGWLRTEKVNLCENDKFLEEYIGGKHV